MRRRGVIALLGIIMSMVPGALGRTGERDECVRTPLRATTVRDREALSPAQVRDLLDDLRRTLLARFGVADDLAFASAHRSSARVRVPVRFHVITNGRSGRLTASDVKRQVEVLNAAYGGRTGGADTGVSFRLVHLDVTVNRRWFARPKHHEHAMMAALRHGGRRTLNLYSAAVGVDVLGFSTFPQWYRRHPRLDGVVIDYRSLPGGGTSHFDRGYTAVHEVGHWLGLLHTFENGCTAPGDSIPDTPYEAEPTEACPWFKDTCPAAGDDPVHNFMDYGYDDCMSEFTPGQARRIRAAWAAYRSG
jgi:Pregnancy-associated plasma protein-A